MTSKQRFTRYNRDDGTVVARVERPDGSWWGLTVDAWFRFAERANGGLPWEKLVRLLGNDAVFYPSSHQHLHVVIKVSVYPQPDDIVGVSTDALAERVREAVLAARTFQELAGLPDWMRGFDGEPLVKP